MGRTKGSAGKTQSVKQNVEAGTAAAPSYTATDVLNKANELIGTVQFDLAHQFCVRALELEPDNASALETIAAVELELGDPESAREHLLRAVELTKDTRPSASAHLYLAQLSDPYESLQYSNAAIAILKSRLEGLSRTAANGMSNGKEKEWSEEETEIRRSASRALVGMTELYLTDLCFEEDAEAKCEELLQSAIQFDPTDPEVYQTMASVRLSQERDEDAVQALDKSWSIWRAAEPGSSAIPPFASRTALAKLFVETYQYLSALEILITLEYEDDTDIQVQYLLGLTWYCLAEQRYHGTSPPGGDGPGLNETAEESGIEARDYFENCLKLQAKQEDEDEADQAMIQHVLEMRSTLFKAGVPETPADDEVGSQTGDAGDGWEDASDDETKDVEMAT